MDLVKFREAFPRYAECTDEQLTFWSELSNCMVCVPVGCKGIRARLPFLMLDHVLTVNGISCAEAQSDPDVLPDDSNLCECDDAFIRNALASGSRISSASIDGMSVTFNNVGINSLISQVAGTSPFHAWLSTTESGRMVSVILRRMAGGPLMAVAAGRRLGHFEEPPVLGHTVGPYGN